LSCEFHTLLDGQVADAAKERCKVLTVDVLHRNEVKGCRGKGNLTDVVHPANVGMSDLSRRSHFPVEACNHRRIAGESFGKELQGSQLVKPEVLRLINFTHASAPQQADDPVTTGEYRTGNEAPAVQWCFISPCRRRSRCSRRRRRIAEIRPNRATEGTGRPAGGNLTQAMGAADHGLPDILADLAADFTDV